MVDKIIKFVKIALWLVPVVFLFWLFNKILLGGILTAKCDADKCSKLVALLQPKSRKNNRETKEGDRYRLIAHDPIYLRSKRRGPLPKRK